MERLLQFSICTLFTRIRVLVRLLGLYARERYSKWSMIIMYTSAALMLMLLTLPLMLIIHGESIRMLQTAAESYPVYVSLFLAVMLTVNALSRRFISRVIIHDPGSQPLSALLTRTEVDFVLSSPFNVNALIAIKLVVDYIIPYTLIITFGSLLSLLLTLMSIHDSLILIAHIIIYIINVILLSTLLGLVNLMIPRDNNHYIDVVAPATVSAYLLASSLINPSLNPLLNMSNIILTPILLLAIMLTLIPILGLTKLIYTDAYGLLQPRSKLSSLKSSFPPNYSTFKIILNTSVRQGFKIALSASIVAFLALTSTTLTLTNHIMRSLEFLVYLLGFFIAYVHTSILGGTLAQERLWINFMAMDGLTYIRLRMLSRLIVTYSSLAPIIIYLLILFLITGSPLVLLEAFSIASMPPLTVPTSWIIMAEAKLPQSRGLIEDNLHRSNVKVLILLGLMYGLAGLFLLPLVVENIMVTTGLIPINGVSGFTLSIGLTELIASALYYLLIMYSGFSGHIWRWFISKLAENGYV
ncbi:hypothetical protein [Caldivirga sp. UBA161]|uniref:hypothetical protein n=1 Tax=Caldivirga sp. UBA161 TaxID=1915569 RepID=UPI0025C40CB5|nr:hypothetical protein [Caldivirga sp. UBA161]